MRPLKSDPIECVRAPLRTCHREISAIFRSNFNETIVDILCYMNLHICEIIIIIWVKIINFEWLLKMQFLLWTQAKRDQNKRIDKLKSHSNGLMDEIIEIAAARKSKQNLIIQDDFNLIPNQSGGKSYLLTNGNSTMAEIPNLQSKKKCSSQCIDPLSWVCWTSQSLESSWIPLCGVEIHANMVHLFSYCGFHSPFAMFWLVNQNNNGRRR